MLKKIRSFFHEESGQSMMEYMLIAVTIVIVIIGLLTKVSTAIKNKFQDIINAINGSSSGGP